MTKIIECDTEKDRLEKACKNDQIQQKQMQLHKLVSMIQDFRAEVDAEQNDQKDEAEEENKDDGDVEMKSDIELMN